MSCPFISLQNAVCFIILTYLVSVLFTFYIQGVLQLKAVCCAEETLIIGRVMRPPKLKHSLLLADDNRTVLRRLRKICEKATVSFAMPLRPHGTTRLPLDRFAWNLVFEDFSKTCRQNSTFINSEKNKLYFTWRPLCILYLLDRASSWKLNKDRPTWFHLLYYFTIYCSTCFEC